MDTMPPRQPPSYAERRAEPPPVIPERWNFATEVLERRAAAEDGPALLFVPRAGEGALTFTWSALDAAANRCANLLAGLGVARGDLALVVVGRVPAWYEVLFAAMKLGVVTMPGTMLLTARDLEYRINRAGARLAVVTPDHAGKIDEIRARCPTLTHCLLVNTRETRPGWITVDLAAAAEPTTLAPDRRADVRASDPMMIYFTSGTTSLPKMVARDYGYALAHTLTGRHWMDLRPGDVHWTLTDTGWAKAAWGLLFPPLLMGATVLLYEGDAKFDVDLHLALIARHRVTTFCAPPTVYRLFAQHDLSGHDFSSLRHCLGAGEPLNPEAMRVWHAATGCWVHDGYGQTETINIVANYPGMEIRPGSMGRPVPGLTVDIVDDEGAVVAADQIGHIAVRLTDPWPPGLFRGYHDDADTNDRVFRHGWYYTGDTARRDADGYIWFVGRADDIISSAGYRISPFEVESALIEHPAVAESAVVAQPDPLRGEIVKAYVVLAAGYRPSAALTEEIQDFVKRQTAPYKYPRVIEYREALPKTISGKIRRVELRAEAAGLRS